MTTCFICTKPAFEFTRCLDDFENSATACISCHSAYDTAYYTAHDKDGFLTPDHREPVFGTYIDEADGTPETRYFQEADFDNVDFDDEE